MGKHYWHVTIKGRNPRVVRHYNHITKMYGFILRNTPMFRGHILSIFDNEQPVVDLSFDQIRERAVKRPKETVERKEILKMGRERNERNKVSGICKRY